MIVVLLLAALPAVFIGAMAMLASVTRANKPSIAEGAQIATLDGGVIRYQSAGQGTQTMLFLHGFNQQLNSWDAVWPHLENCPVRRIRLDIPGFGASRFATDDYSLGMQADRLAAFLDSLRIERATVIGVSMGGSLAVAFAARHPDRAERLVLLAPSGYPGSLQHGGLFGQVVRPGFTRQAAGWLAATPVYKALFPNSVALQAVTVTKSYGAPWLQQLRHTQTPAFIAWSKSDRTANAEDAPKVAGALRNSTLFWLNEAAGHGIHQTRPQFVAQAACLAAQGADPETVAEKMSPEILFPGEGVVSESWSGTIQ